MDRGAFSAMQRSKKTITPKAYFAPRVNFSTGKIEGAEVVTTFAHRDVAITLDSISNQNLRNLTICRTFDSIFKQALSFQGVLQQHSIFIPMSFRLSTSQLNNTAFACSMKYLALSYNVHPSQICLIIQNSYDLISNKIITSNIIILRLIGFKLCLSEAEKSHHPLLALCQLPLSELEIDSNSLHSTQAQGSICGTQLHAALSIAKTKELSLTVKNISTYQKMHLASQLGFESGQGSLLSEPLSTIDFIGLYLP